MATTVVTNYYYRIYEHFNVFILRSTCQNLVLVWIVLTFK
jgi:hypothetical protein